MTATPAFPLTVPDSLWMAVADAQTPAFADSYLYGAHLTSRTLSPRTITAWMALRDKASKTLAALGITLVKPPPFHESGQVSVADEMGVQPKRPRP